METKAKQCAVNCTQCIYREQDIGHCWYTMTTNNPNYIENSYCLHYANKDEVIDRIEKRNKKQLQQDKLGNI